MSKKTGLLCFIFKHRNSSQDGLSNFISQFDEVTLTGGSVSGPFAPTEKAPEVVMRKHGDYLFCSPPDHMEHWYMFGGTFVYTSDGRFPCSYPLPLHDRREN